MKNNKQRNWEKLYERLMNEGQNAELVLSAELETEYYEKNNNNAIISSNFNNVYCWLLRLKKIQ